MSLDDLDYSIELDKLDIHGLLESDAQERYIFYRRKGHAPAVAYDYAVAWQQNAIEQRIRRWSHQSGYGTEEVPSRLPDRPGVGRRERRYTEGR